MVFTSTKETPRKPKMRVITDIPHQPIVIVVCPKCHQRIANRPSEMQYCNHCGQRLGWDLEGDTE